MREALFGIFSLLFIAYFSESASSTIVFKPLSISLPDLPAKFGNFPSSLSCLFTGKLRENFAKMEL